MRNSRCVAAFSIFSVVFAFHGSCAQDDFDLERFFKAWKMYIRNPSSLNTTSVIAALPFPSHVRYSNSPFDHEVSDSVYENFGVVDDRVSVGDRQSVTLAIRMYSMSDGALTEWINEMLSNMIAQHPRVFLEAVKADSAYLLSGDDPGFIEYVVTNVLVYKITREAERDILRDRIKALEGVKQKQLRVLRDLFISCLKKELLQ